MRHSGGPPWHRGDWGPGPPGWSPGRHVGFRLFGLLFFLLFVSAVVGGLIAWISSSNPWLFLLAGLGFLVLFGFGATRMVRRTWTPVSRLIDATTRLGEGDTSARIPEQGRGPWGSVSRSFNRMAERLEDEDKRRKRLLADLGHEMRTPLAVIRGEIEAVIDGVHQPDSLKTVVDEVEMMERLLEDLRTLALAEAGGLELRLVPTDLEEVCREVLSSFESRLTNQDVEANCYSDTAARELLVDPIRIRQVLSNLISNAIDQMPDGGRLEVSIGPNRIVVADTGPGIPDEALDGIFDRFEKSSDSQGSGLGLSIVRDLVEAHGGHISADNNPGGGAVFVITVPDQPPGG